MESKFKADGLFADQSPNVVRYKRNFLHQVVCELRFPTLMALGEAQPPAKLAAALRLDYPYLELANEVTFGLGGSSSSSNTHVFRSSKMNWSVSVKQSTISIETTAYTNFAALESRINRLIDAAAETIDSDFFTRIGLRYINLVDARGEDPVTGEWINPSLVSPLLEQKFIGIDDYAGRIQLRGIDGGCLLQHGIKIKPPFRGEPVAPDYLIDIDVYRSDIQVSEAKDTLLGMHKQAFNIFDWSLGEKSREHLSSNEKIKG